MAQRRGTLQDDVQAKPGKIGQIAFVAGALLILLLGLLFLWSSNAPYHPEISDDVQIAPDAATRYDATLLD